MPPTYLFSILRAIRHRPPFRPSMVAFRLGLSVVSVFPLWSASLTLPDNPFTMPSADFPRRLRARDLPGFSPLLSMRNCRIYVIRLLDNWRTSGCVAPSSLCIPPHIRFLFVSPHVRRRPPQGLLTEDTFAFGYTSALSTCGWTCSLTITKPKCHP